MFKRPEAKHAKSSVFDSRLLISVENDGLFDVHVCSSKFEARDESPSLPWRPGIGISVTQRHCVFKPIT